MAWSSRRYGERRSERRCEDQDSGVLTNDLDSAVSMGAVKYGAKDEDK